MQIRPTEIGAGMVFFSTIAVGVALVGLAASVSHIAFLIIGCVGLVGLTAGTALAIGHPRRTIV